jgi:predicted amidohydrolase YtcJ
MSDAPDLIVTEARVWQGNGGQDDWAEAFACREGRILAVGSAAQIQSLAGPSTQVLRLSGATVLPGFNDTHLHPLLAGLRKTECRIPQGSDMGALQAAVRQAMANLPSDGWITGGQWDSGTLGRVPDRSELDALTGDIPALLNDTSGHSALANTAALHLANLTAETPDPPQGIIERRADGSLSGVLRERAIELVQAHVPKPSHEAMCRALKAAHDELLSFGVTLCTEASIGMIAGAEAELRVYRDVIASGGLHQRTRIFLVWEPDDPVAEDIIARRHEYAHPLLDLDNIKIHLDGVPTDGHTAAMLEPYEEVMEGRYDEAARFGLLLQDPTALATAVTRFDAEGILVKYHAVGDRAVRMGLDAIAAARAANGPTGRCHEIGHSTFVDERDIVRGRELGAVFELSPYLWGPCPINDDIMRAVGPSRIERIWPFREIIDAGAMVIAGSDWPVVDDVNPWPAIETLLTREAPGGGSAAFGKRQAISLREAIDLFTLWPAEVFGQSQQGRLAPGYMADFIVLDCNPFDIPVHNIHRVQCMATFVGGRSVFHRSRERSFQSAAPQFGPLDLLPGSAPA